MKKITIRELAKIADVSTATVSRAFNSNTEISEKTRARIMKLARQYEYYPSFHARNLAKNRSKTIALFISHKPKYVFSNYHANEVLTGITDVLTENSYSILLIIYNDQDFTSFFKNKQVDGAIFFAIKYNENIEELINGNYPFVCIGYHEEAHRINYIDVDNYKGTYIATEYLINLGHRNIAHIGANTCYSSGIERVRGYREALYNNNLSVNENNILHNEECLQDTAKDLTSNILKRNRNLTAIMAFNDDVAIGVTIALKQNGLKIPEDISIIGFDNTLLSEYTNPPLTTVAHPSYNKGKVAAEKLLNIIENKSENTQKLQVLLTPEFIIRESCFSISNG